MRRKVCSNPTCSEDTFEIIAGHAEKKWTVRCSVCLEEIAELETFKE